MKIKSTEPINVPYVTPDDISIVVARIPPEDRTRLRDVFISDRHHGMRRLGSVRTRGRRDIDLYAILPPRVSLGRYMWRGGRNAPQYGAPARGQWPPWAVRRFLLYDTFIHELGHLQLVLPKSSNWQRKYAGETVAQDFSNRWRAKLWSKWYDHPDPVHNAPQADEMETIKLWERLDKAKRYLLVHLALNAPHEELPDLTPFGELTHPQRAFLTRALCHSSPSDPSPCER